jgi:hypothetical protein
LIKLSPKKTWEGFIGASVTTIVSAFLVRWKPWLIYSRGYYSLASLSPLFLAVSECNGPFPMVDVSKKGDLLCLSECDSCTSESLGCWICSKIYYGNICRTCQQGGFIVILLLCLSQSITSWETRCHSG